MVGPEEGLMKEYPFCYKCGSRRISGMGDGYRIDCDEHKVELVNIGPQILRCPGCMVKKHPVTPVPGFRENNSPHVRKFGLKDYCWICPEVIWHRNDDNSVLMYGGKFGPALAKSESTERTELLRCPKCLLLPHPCQAIYDAQIPEFEPEAKMPDNQTTYKNDNPNTYIGDPPPGQTPWIGDPPQPGIGTAVPGIIQPLSTGWKCPQCGYIMAPHMAGCYHCNK